MRLNYPEDFHIRALLKKVKIQEVMTTPVISIDVEAPFGNVVKLSQGRHIRHLPVVNSQMEVVGLMTQRDLYKIQPPHKNEDGQWVYDFDMLDGIILKTVMTPNPVTLTHDRPLAEAILPMVRHKYGCIPIVDQQKKLCGIITSYDILKIAFDILEEGK